MTKKVTLKIPSSFGKLDADLNLLFIESAFYRFISQLTSNVCENLSTFINENGLSNHLNHLLFTPDPESEEVQSLSDRQNYCEEFSNTISAGNAHLVLNYVYLTIDLDPHWVFKISYTLEDERELQLLLTFTDKELVECEVESYTDMNGIDFPIKIDDHYWDHQSTWYQLNKQNF